ncbi:uncharacterized protein LOC106639761 [Copidosoma floridanum]|uniref:uncharacterized protein LOC106639761 n=1 Tax=Copidosoma floridanum TaxID=29053 RepID=UPI0006C9AEE4|nr:uncharacterized protein LOC106639761 [Copidosoma floridanum]
MDVVLQKHQAKPVCEVPDGLCELCADISREVIRYQPDDAYCFIADYLDALLITRENANIAVKVVRNVVMRGEQIAEILAMTGLKLEEIAAAMPRLRNAFREYLDAIEAQNKSCGCDDIEAGEQCEMSICCILRGIGVSYQKAQSAAIKIQAAFRGHYERMLLAEKRGDICWQRAAVTTIEILRKAGVSRSEAVHAATVIQSVYRGYYTRRNLKLREERLREMGIVEAKGAIGGDLDAWFSALLEETGLTLTRANEAAIIIQTVFRQYWKRKHEEPRSLSKSLSSPSKLTALSTTSTDIASSSQASARKRTGPSGVAESSEDDYDGKVKELRFQSNVQISIIEAEGDRDYARNDSDDVVEEGDNKPAIPPDSEDSKGAVGKTEEKVEVPLGSYEESREVENAGGVDEEAKVSIAESTDQVRDTETEEGKSRNETLSESKGEEDERKD